MVVNKHSSFYMRSGWGTKIIEAVKSDDMIFTPSNEQQAVDNIGLGRVIVKALRYWSDAMGLTTESKSSEGIQQIPTELYRLIEQYDKYFQRQGSLLLLHRNLAKNIDSATAWYWLFNEWNGTSFDREEFVNGFHSYLAVNGMKVKKDAVNKEFNCLKNTYFSDKKIDLKTAMDEDTYPFLAPLEILRINDQKKYEKNQLSKHDVPLEILIYSIAMDNLEASRSKKQVSIDTIMDEKLQIGKYFNMKYSKLIEMLIEAENRKYISLNNNFGNRFIEFLDMDYSKLLNKYYMDKE
ncbi:DUF4007 family protein [[Clostridium] fimetarium]|uniref:DUF4007 domain-containing protein n=1 Tax=[Clostridium] fimetarium TaxID=99656 RepID=A0A1I0NET3_9FIRM|nr:DUF4007 family protein [[Clostridium] fimetarium]SEV99929.1 Protein of unknown function [[Clostridium] fimetarium]